VSGVRGVAVTDAPPSVRQVRPSLVGTVEGTVARHPCPRLSKPCQSYRQLSDVLLQWHP